LHITQRALGIAGQALRNGIRILVGHDLLANLEVLVAKRMLKSRVRVIAEGHISLKFPDTGIDPLTLARARRLLPTADGIVAVSNGIRRELIDYYRVSPAKVATFYNVFRPGEIRRLAEEPAPETAGRAPFIVACGRFVEAKGLSDLIRAFARVRARRPLTLVLLGDGPPVLRASRRVLPAVAVGRGLPSRHRRGHGLRDAGHRVALPLGARGAFEGDRYGILYDAGNVEQLAVAIGRVLDDRQESARLVAAGLRRAEDFEESKILPRLEAYYCDGRPAARDHIMTA